MAGFSRLKLSTKFNLMLCSLLLGLFLFNILLTYRDQQQLVRQVALDEGRNIATQLLETFRHMSEIVRDEPERNYNLVPQVVANQIAKKISDRSHYRVREVSLRYRNPDNRPDAYEAQQLQRFASGDEQEIYQVTKDAGIKVFRYMKALPADKSCLKCHGSFEAAPSFIQQRFPKGHPSYNYHVGEIIGAVSVTKPMTELYRQVASSLRHELLYRGGMLLLVILLTLIFVQQLIIKPLQRASLTIHRVTSTGDLSARIPTTQSRDEIGQLLVDFNEMMQALDRTTLQRQESEDRYRSLIEASQSAIVTFLENGKIVISNQQAEQLFGCTRTRLLGECVFDFFTDGELLRQRVIAFAQSATLQNQHETASYRLLEAVGDRQDIEVTLVLASAAEGKPMFTAILRA